LKKYYWNTENGMGVRKDPVPFFYAKRWKFVRKEKLAY